jgi:phosphoglycerate kinase
VPERLARKAAGRLMVAEVEALGRLLEEPERPFVAILGGAKIEGKVEALENLLPRLDRVALGGGMANTFLAAQGHDLGDSLVEEDRLETAREILAAAERRGVEVLLPGDLVVAPEIEGPEAIRTVAPGEVPAGWKALDIGETSRRIIGAALREARTVFWNGPMGVFEHPPFDAGTMAVAAALAACPGYTVLGGGETLAAATRAGIRDRVDHASTGGGAALELLSGKTLPGVAALERR